MTSITFSIPGEPRGKGRPRFNGHARTDAKTRAHESMIAKLARLEMGARKPLTGPVGLALTVITEPAKSWAKCRRAMALDGDIRPTKAPDLDNIIKLVSDALNGVVFGDDSQVVDITAAKVYGPLAVTTVTVWELAI